MNFKGKSVLIIGDSHSVGTYSVGRTLARLLEEAKASVAVDARVGRSAYSFFRHEGGKDKLKLYRDQRPDVVIVFLGTNTTSTPSQWRELASWPEGTKVVCFGPPYLSGAYAARVKRDHVVSRQKKAFSNWVDLRSLSKDIKRTPDRVHFPVKGAEVLAKRLYDLLSARSFVKIPSKNLGLPSLYSMSTVFPLLWIIERRNRLRGQG